MRTIVVTSTAANAVGYAGKCVASVERAAQKLGIDWVVRHLFATPDAETAKDAATRGAEVYERNALAIQNCSFLWRSLAPETIVVWLDGDDELTPDALERVALLYERSDVWLTYGSFVRSDRIVDWMVHNEFGRRYLGAPRLERWRASHLKTFRAGLVQAVPPGYLEVAGKPVTHAIDHAVMLSLLELAGQRYAVSTDVNCIYNVGHSASVRDPRETEAREREALGWLRALQPLDPLEQRPW